MAVDEPSDRPLAAEHGEALDGRRCEPERRAASCIRFLPSSIPKAANLNGAVTAANAALAPAGAANAAPAATAA
jgi:hypothetical protein